MACCHGNPHVPHGVLWVVVLILLELFVMSTPTTPQNTKQAGGSPRIPCYMSLPSIPHFIYFPETPPL